MILLYAEEHCSCFNYEQKYKGAIEIEFLKTADVLNLTSEYNRILFVIKGSVQYSLENIHEKKISEGNMVLYPSGSKLDVRALSESTKLEVLIFIF